MIMKCLLMIINLNSQCSSWGLGFEMMVSFQKIKLVGGGNISQK